MREEGNPACKKTSALVCWWRRLDWSFRLNSSSCHQRHLHYLLLQQNPGRFQHVSTVWYRLTALRSSWKHNVSIKQRVHRAEYQPAVMARGISRELVRLWRSGVVSMSHRWRQICRCCCARRCWWFCRTGDWRWRLFVFIHVHFDWEGLI